MKKITKHMFTASGHYIGSKEVPFWFSWINAQSITITILSIILSLGIIFGLNSMPKSHNSQVNITNALPF